jgi:hypothetical protein
VRGGGWELGVRLVVRRLFRLSAWLPGVRAAGAKNKVAAASSCGILEDAAGLVCHSPGAPAGPSPPFLAADALDDAARSRFCKLRRACGRSLSNYINLGRDVADGVVGVRLLLKSHLTAPSLRLVS